MSVVTPAYESEPITDELPAYDSLSPSERRIEALRFSLDYLSDCNIDDISTFDFNRAVVESVRLMPYALRGAVPQELPSTGLMLLAPKGRIPDHLDESRFILFCGDYIDDVLDIYSIKHRLSARRPQIYATIVKKLVDEDSFKYFESLRD